MCFVRNSQTKFPNVVKRIFCILVLVTLHFTKTGDLVPFGVVEPILLDNQVYCRVDRMKTLLLEENLQFFDGDSWIFIEGDNKVITYTEYSHFPCKLMEIIPWLLCKS